VLLQNNFHQVILSNFDIFFVANLKSLNLGLNVNKSMKHNFCAKAHTQKTVKTAMDGSFRDFGKVSQDGLNLRKMV